MSGIRFAAPLFFALTALLLTALVGHASAASKSDRAAKATHRYHRTHAVSGSTGQAVFSFGIQGGNIRPWNVTISDDGSVTATGSIKHIQKLADPTNTLNGLLKLADAETFFALPKHVRCSGVLPDVAARWITIKANGDSWIDLGRNSLSGDGACASVEPLSKQRVAPSFLLY
jgi:hypothetical protein